MKRWAILTVLLYALALLLLTVPIILLAFGNWGVHNDNQTFKETMQVIAAWQYWLWLGLLMAGQVVLLLVPISLAEKRLPARRKLKVPVIVAGFFRSRTGCWGTGPAGKRLKWTFPAGEC